MFGAKSWEQLVFHLLFISVCSSAITEVCNTADDPLGQQYAGTVNQTYTGIPCQRWDTRSPHWHSTKESDLPDDSLQAAENYCRNPDREAGPWCYTVDRNVRFQRCHVPGCDCKAADDELGHQYLGTRNTTHSGRGCQAWRSKTPHWHNVSFGHLPDRSLESAENFCRNPDNMVSGPWCYTLDKNSRWEYCPVPTCECSVHLTSPIASFKSPGYPSPYPQNLNCSWNILVEEGKVVALEFEDFKLQTGKDCKFDSVTMYDGSSRTDPVLGTYCGKSVPPKTYSSGNALLVTFFSDSTANAEGFKAGYITREKRNLTEIRREAQEKLKNNWERQTRDEIMGDYSQDIPALGDQPVHIGYTLTKIIDVDEKAEEIALAVYITLWWRDERLVYDRPEKLNDSSRSKFAYEHGSLIFKLSQLWYPNVVHYNNVGDGKAELMNKDRNAITDGTGVLYWSKNVVLTSPCDMDVTYFPVDTQVCEVMFSIEPQGPVKISGQVKARTNPNAYYPDSAWSIDRENDITRILDDDYLTVTFRQTFRRKHQYYISRILGPVSIISVLVICVFIIPPDAGEKIALGVTLLLTFSVFQMIVDDELPASSNSTPLITRAMILLQVCSAMSIVASVMVLHVHHISVERANKVPRWLRWIFFTALAKVTCHTRDVKRITVPENMVTMSPVELKYTVDDDYAATKVGVPVETMAGILSKDTMILRSINANLEELSRKISGSGDTAAREWKLLARILDRILMYTCMIVMAGIYASLLLQLQQHR